MGYAKCGTAARCSVTAPRAVAAGTARRRPIQCVRTALVMLAESLVRVAADPQVELLTAQSTGSADQAVLVIHGGPDWDHSYLREPLTEIGSQYRLIMPDLRGCGRSTCGLPIDQYTPDAVVADLLALLDTAGLGTADVLASHATAGPGKLATRSKARPRNRAAGTAIGSQPARSLNATGKPGSACTYTIRAISVQHYWGEWSRRAAS